MTNDDAFLVEFYKGIGTGDVDENQWNGQFITIKMYGCPQFCICDEFGECFERANGSEPIGYAELHPFCDLGGLKRA